ncbi:hypothetical protein ENSA5_20160 [Enhygromyxa salina]|uniref:Uncharacterized protein n=1 Tax=Enhygromyxa salina TaxID=215803 RepID=A0A2S9YCK9_9BACT|nr:hypothetical protein [Enhygromyxa salina]PRQ02839.1 hypothetical protein ENSA5_20160 [Enhygromyxa salina]
MAKRDKGKDKGKGSGGRTTVLAALLAIITLVAMWLSDCIPGFGIGSSGSADGEPEASEKAEPAEPEPEPKPEPEPEPEPKPEKLEKPGPLEIVVDARGCIIGDAAPQDCAALCEQDELFEGVNEVKIDTTEGPHDKVVALLDCVKNRGLEVAVTRE